MADFVPLPAVAAWRLLEAHEGFEVAHLTSGHDDVRIAGTSVGVEDGLAWSFRYDLEIGADWHARSGSVRNADGGRLTLESDGPGRWLVDDVHDPALDGCLDIDLEGSALTNTMPVHRLALGVGEEAAAPAVYVRTNSLAVERLDQTYRRVPAANGFAFEYAAPRFGYRASLPFAADGLVQEYPGIAARVTVGG
ncbi:MAG TPA: putative glycolipid-binding domain-containing protein [Actinophytocola sp.]|nr:putative glycolipid-binding domain-containing protein [Actinophytocola sp.]